MNLRSISLSVFCIPRIVEVTNPVGSFELHPRLLEMPKSFLPLHVFQHLCITVLFVPSFSKPIFNLHKTILNQLFMPNSFEPSSTRRPVLGSSCFASKDSKDQIPQELQPISPIQITITWNKDQDFERLTRNSYIVKCRMPISHECVS